MNKFVFYCSHCNQSFTGEGYAETDRPRCPQCSKKTFPTGMTQEQWAQTPKPEREKITASLSQPNTIHAPTGTSVVSYIDEHLGIAKTVQSWIFVLLWIGIAFFLLGLLTQEESLLFCGIGAIGVFVGLLVDFYLACWFCKVAIMKGHREAICFWMPFVFTLIGYLFVIALPDRANNTGNTKE